MVPIIVAQFKYLSFHRLFSQNTLENLESGRYYFAQVLAIEDILMSETIYVEMWNLVEMLRPHERRNRIVKVDWFKVVGGTGKKWLELM